MRKCFFYLTAVTIICVALPAAPRAQSIANGGFESGSKSLPDGWFPTYTDRMKETVEKVSFFWDKEIKHGGERSVAIEISKNFPWRLDVHYNWTTKMEGWEVGKTYEVTAWVKTQNTRQPAFLIVQCWDSNEKRMLSLSQPNRRILGNEDWATIKTKFKVPKGTGVVRIRAGVSTTENNSGCKVWFDDVQVAEVSK
jgi:hypothetical protein